MNIDIVLVRTEYERNVGATARAMGNLGASRLILIDPHCEIGVPAHQAAAGAQKWLEGAVTYRTWNDFYAREGQGVRIAMTRRSGKKRQVFELCETLTGLREESRHEGQLYLIFGPEASGLDVEDMAQVNFACHLPVQGEFASLNLAQAVLLTLFLVRQSFPVTPAASTSPVAEIKAKEIAPLEFPDRLVKDWLTKIGFDIESPKANAYLTIKRLLLQNQPTPHENRVLESVLQQTVRKL
jgi:tRNA/rRNA methyltransferase